MHNRSGTVDEYITSLKASPRFGPQVVHHERIAASAASHSVLAPAFAAPLRKALIELGIEALYSHQVQAMEKIRQGRDILVATPTASGKSLIFNLPVCEKILENAATTALYLFPLKALAQDQLRSVQELIRSMQLEKPMSAAVYDGDTSVYRRGRMRENPPNILISNPDMLHLSMLPYHGSWSSFWKNLRFVVLDEAHTYRGVFGSHVAWVIRRLQRICRLHGADPRFLLFSATVGNPETLGNDLLGRPVELIGTTGAPRGNQHFILFDPLEGAASTASQMLEAALKRGLRAIVYTQSRKMTELVAGWTQSRLGPLRQKLAAYRAGFLPEDRREIEARLADGELLGVVSTSALELGIDIGNLDICILVGYPGSIMSTWQRGGRVGRRQRDSLVLLLAQEDALDQYFMRHPRDFFERPVEDAVLNPFNQVIMRRHLVCAAAEVPLSRNEPLLAVAQCLREAEDLTGSGELLLNAAGDTWFTNRKYPQREVDLRGSGKNYTIRRSSDHELIGEIDEHRCFKECHPGAVYLHMGVTWLVERLDLDARLILVRQARLNYFTRAMSTKETEILDVHENVQLGNIRASLGFLRVTDQVTGFQRKLLRGQKTIGTEYLDLPPQVFETEGLWFEVPLSLQHKLEKREMHFMGGIHAVEHAAIGVFPLLVLCDRNDVGGISYPFHPQLQVSAIFIYDGYAGGVGLARQVFQRIRELLQVSRKTIIDCSCQAGCPSCVHSPKCGSGNRPIDKAAALAVLDGLLEESVVAGHAAAFVDQKEKNRKMVVPASTGIRRELPRRYGVFDVETKRSADEVGGWHRAEKMGVSVAVVYDGEKGDFFVYREEQMAELIAHLRGLDLVVGFNNKRFDYRVLSAYTDFDLARLPSLDILEEVKNRLGYRLSLERLAEKTLGIKKSGSGLLALQWYKEGRFDKIIDYCRKDVEITRDLLLFGVCSGYLLFQNKAGHTVRCPVEFGCAVANG
ncbi:MAG: DEAD/DEAH box helicase [Desulfobulbaceae bacterium DB1]|nr:MAG: DEAD/DEAH box helicase [Desulfobulbaceae bacterium DB1]